MIPLWMKALDSLGVLEFNKTDRVHGLPVQDCILLRQGPSYIFAKRLQIWRAVVARNEGHLVSSNVAPVAATDSVVSNTIFAGVMGGMHIFKPIEVVYPETGETVMAALLINDLKNP